MEITYEMIAPLIVHQEIEGRNMIVEFETPDGEVVSSSAPIKQGSNVQGVVAREASRVAKRQARRVSSRLVRGALGGGMMGRIGSRVVRTSTRETMRNTNFFSQGDKEAAIVAAFKRVKHKFIAQEEQPEKERPRVRISKKEMSTLPLLEAQLKKYPIDNPYDREILARMLTELADADGRITSDEKAFLEESIGSDFGSIDELLSKDSISRVECEEVSEKVKPSIYMLAWVMSLIDMELDPAEERLLMDFADMMKFSNRQVDEAMKAAKYYIIEQTMGIDASKDELFELADAIGLSRDEAERCLIQMKKRTA